MKRTMAPTRPIDDQLCEQDQTVMVADTAGSTSVMEVLDNGLMTRKLERLRDAVELRKDHTKIPEKKDPTIV